MSESLSDAERRLIEQATARIRAGVMAIVFGMLGGLSLFVATAWLLIRGGPDVGRHLGLLRHYLPGFSVTWPGSLLGLLYGTAIGGILGWSIARIYNRVADWSERRGG